MKKLYGIIPAMVTPFDEKGTVNLSQVKRLTAFLIEKGIDCLYPTGTTGEMNHMTVEERKKTAEAVIEEANGRCPVFVHVGCMSLKDTQTLAVHASDARADGIGVVTPIYFNVNQREMEAYFQEVARSVPEDFPIYLYNIPQLSGNDLTVQSCERLASCCSNIVGIKYSLPDLRRTIEYTKVLGGKFSVIQGADHLLFPSVAAGCDGVISGCANVFPEIFTDAMKAVRKNDMDLAKKQQERVMEAWKTLCLGEGSAMAYMKAGLRMRGIDAGHMRSPLMDLTKDQEETFKDGFEKIMKWVE